MALVGLSRPKAVHGLEIVGHGIENSKYDALRSAYADAYDVRTSRSAYDVRTSRSAYFELVGHGHPKKITIDTSKVSQHLPRLDQGALVAFEALATPVELLERGEYVLVDTTQRKVSPESLRSLAWGKNTDHENGIRSDVNESTDVTRIITKNEVEAVLMSSSFRGNVSSAKSMIPNEFPVGLNVNSTIRETIYDESENLRLHKSELDGKQPSITKSDFLNNKLIPIWNQSFTDRARGQRNQSLIFRGSAVQRSQWSTFNCHSGAAESFNDVIAPMNASFSMGQSKKSSQVRRPQSSLIPNSKYQGSRHLPTRRGKHGLPWQSSSYQSTLFVVGHSKYTPKVNTFSTETPEAPYQRTAETESVVLGPQGTKFSSRMRERTVQKNKHNVEALSGGWVNKCFIDGTKNELCNSCVADSGKFTNGYAAFKGYTPKSKPITTSPVKSPTSPGYSTLGNFQPKPQNSESAHYDQNGGRMAPGSGSEPHGCRTPSRTGLHKSNATYSRNLSEAKVMQSSNSDPIQTSSIENQVICDSSLNRAIGSPISSKLNSFCNPDENRTKDLTASNTKVENCRNRMENFTVTMESSENQMENSRASTENSKMRMENSTGIIKNSTGPVENSSTTTQFSTATVENSDISSTSVENSKVSFMNNATVCLSPTSRLLSLVTPRSPSRSSQLHSIQYPEPVLNGSTDLSNDLTCNNSSTNNNEDPMAETKKCNNQVIEAQLQKNDSMTLIDEKDGHYFLGLVAQVESDLRKNCTELEHFLKGSIPDEASGKIRAAIGKANLLMTKKFKQFRELCNSNLTQSCEDQFQTTSEDLTGYWDLIQLQVDDIQHLFHDIHTLQSNNWVDSEPQTSFAPLSPKATEVRPKEQATQSTKKPRSSKVSDASKAREESRKRLMAAKLAGRQRRASETEEEIQIFIS